ncbi:hypothetical protein ABSL23_03535 [Halobacterium sp. NMX12-1]|uniref:Uncharacterized protein n=1 Tax=Halobacterium sp. NMX12-1 TaxID=3166650 RepID=A0AAU8CFQ5_9EURY
MIDSLDDVPDYVEEEVRNRIGAGGDGSTLIIDESKEEYLLGYTGFTKALKREYENACEDRREEAIKVYQIRIDSSGVQLTRYESANGENAEKNLARGRSINTPTERLIHAKPSW